MIDLFLSGFIAWLVYNKTKDSKKALLSGLGVWILCKILCHKSIEDFDLVGTMEQEWEKVDKNIKKFGEYPTNCSPTKQSYYDGHPVNAPHAAHPFIDPPYLLRNKGDMAGQEGFGGDLTLTNLYRRLHNLDAIQRTEVFQFNDALAGGSYGIPREPWVGEAYDRGMMDLKQQIREDIAKKRRPYSEAYDIPTKPLMGNFWECHIGDCQWDADDNGAILGIPSQVGVHHAYY